MDRQQATVLQGSRQYVLRGDAEAKRRKLEVEASHESEETRERLLRELEEDLAGDLPDVSKSSAAELDNVGKPELVKT